MGGWLSRSDKERLTVNRKRKSELPDEDIPVNPKNIVDFFNISKQYNLPNLSRSAISWLADNLLLLDDTTASLEFLKQIPIDLMQETIERPDLVVIQVEQDVLLLLIKWVFLLSHPNYEYDSGSLPIEDAYRYFVSTGTGFLDSAEGAVFTPVFKAVRWEHVLNVYGSAQRLLRDRLIPEAWLSRVFTRQWLRVLRSHDMHTSFPRSSSPDPDSSSTGNHGDSPGRSRLTLSSRQMSYASSVLDSDRDEPGPPVDLSEEVFWATSERCGRKMHHGDVTCSWRWTGYHFGFDVVVKYKRRTFSIIRFAEPHTAEGSVSHAPLLRLMISMRVRSIPSDPSVMLQQDPSLNDEPVDVINSPDRIDGSSSKEISSGVLSLSLEENVLHEVIHLPDDFTFPAVVAANILRFDPLDAVASSEQAVDCTLYC